MQSLDDYIANRAGQDTRNRVTAVWILHDGEEDRIAGYYTLSATSVELDGLPPDVTKQLPRYPTVPANIIGRLAVDSRHQGQGLGAMLVFDAFVRAVKVSETVAAWAIIVDALDENAKEFYEHHDFVPLTSDGQRLYIEMSLAEKLVREVLGQNE